MDNLPIFTAIYDFNAKLQYVIRHTEEYATPTFLLLFLSIYVLSIHTS